MRQMERRMEWQSEKLGHLQQRGLDDVRKSKEVTIPDLEITRLKKDVYDERKRNSDLRSIIDRLKQIGVLSSAGTSRRSRSSIRCRSTHHRLR